MKVQNADFKKHPLPFPWEKTTTTMEIQWAATENLIVRELFCNEHSSWMTKLCERNRHSFLDRVAGSLSFVISVQPDAEDWDWPGTPVHTAIH